MFLLDRCSPLNRLTADLVLFRLDIPRCRSIHGGHSCGGDTMSATRESQGLSMTMSGILTLRAASPLMMLLALILSACGDKPSQPAAAAAPPVTVAQPTTRTVTDWDEFTGRFDAVEEVQVRARVGGFV